MVWGVLDRLRVCDGYTGCWVFDGYYACTTESICTSSFPLFGSAVSNDLELVDKFHLASEYHLRIVHDDVFVVFAGFLLRGFLRVREFILLCTIECATKVSNSSSGSDFQ